MPELETVGKQSDPADKGKGAGGDGQQVEYVPIQRLEEEIGKRQTLETQLAELRGKVDGLSAAAPKRETKAEEPRLFSRAELRDAVERGKCTQAEADSIWDSQQERKTGEKIAAVKTEVVQEVTEKAKIGAQIERYKEIRPDIGKPDSDDHKKVKAEFEYLVTELGMPRNDLKTELAALRAVFGAPERLTAKRRDNRPDPNRETASRGGDGESANDEAGVPRDLTAKQKSFYQRGIDAKRYKGWDDPTLKAELKIIRSRRQAAA